MIILFSSKVFDLNLQSENQLLSDNALLEERHSHICFGGHLYNESQRNVLSFCLFGYNAVEMYGKKIRKIAKESSRSKLYNSWQILIFTNVDVPEKFIQKVKRINTLVRFCKIQDMQYVYSNLEKTNAMTWRFVPMADKSVDIFCSRDLDSPLLERETEAVSEWLASSEMLHVMRDNPKHSSKIMGGMWCLRNKKNPILANELVMKVWRKAMKRNATHESSIGNDQLVLNKVVWPRLVNDVMQHDSYLCSRYKGSRPFPTQRIQGTFVGCKRKCQYKDLSKCPERCRPKNHQDWKYC